MNSQSVETVADGLLRGQLESLPGWELGEAARWIADAIARADARAGSVQLRAACGVLNRHRHFDLTRMLGEAWIAIRGFDATVQRQLAQALINLSALDTADGLLQGGLARLQAAPVEPLHGRELPEYLGLRARVDKQRFADTGDADALLRATRAYLDAYRTLKPAPYWHGINAVALLARQAREGYAGAEEAGTAEQIAAEIRARQLTAWQNDPSDHWRAATLSEAALALNQWDEAELWLYRFLHHPNAKPFDIDSYDRQLREIWQGNPVGPGPVGASRLAAIIAQHMLRSQSRLALSPGTLSALKEELKSNPQNLEKNFSGERSFGLDTLKQIIDACGAIGCVSNRRGERLGTGFLLGPGELSKNGRWADTPVFVTNAHVISTEVPNALLPQDALVSFEAESSALEAPRYYAVEEVLFTSSPAPLGTRCPDGLQLDVTVVRLKDLDARTKALALARSLPLVDAKARAYVVGHPLGSGLQLSLHDSQLIDIDEDRRLVHYRTPTDPGSSGSPVFNGSWKVIALHHGGSSETPRLRGEGRYEANEGITFEAIRRKLPTI